MADVLKALSNPHRLAMLERLAACCAPGVEWETEDGAACVGDLGQGLPVAPSTLSHHLKELARAGLITTRRDGQKVLCSLAPEALKDLAGFFSGLMGPAPAPIAARPEVKKPQAPKPAAPKPPPQPAPPKATAPKPAPPKPAPRPATPATPKPAVARPAPPSPKPAPPQSPAPKAATTPAPVTVAKGAEPEKGKVPTWDWLERNE